MMNRLQLFLVLIDKLLLAHCEVTSKWVFMFGFIVPNRWVVSLALLGLVSVFMASHAAEWANPASAATGATTVVATPTATPIPDVVLDGIFHQDSEGSETGGPTPDVTLSSGSTSHWDWVAITGSGSISTHVPGVTFQISSSNTGCVTIGSESHNSSPSKFGYNLIASSTAGCTSTMTVTLRQRGLNPHSDSFVIAVNASGGTSSQTFEPATVEDFTGTIFPPTGLGSSVIPITPKNGGKLTVPASGGGFIILDVPGGSVDSGEGAQVSITTVDPNKLAPPPAAAAEGSSSGTFKFGHSVVQITWYNERGAPSASGSKVLNRSAQVCMTATAAEASDAHGGPDGLGIWRHNGTDWVKLNSTVSFDAAAQTYKVCANSSRFSPFALGLDVAPPEAGEVATGLPATGDYSPNALTIVMAMLAGFALVGTGVVTARRSRRVREDS